MKTHMIHVMVQCHGCDNPKCNNCEHLHEERKVDLLNKLGKFYMTVFNNFELDSDLKELNVLIEELELLKG